MPESTVDTELVEMMSSVFAAHREALSDELGLDPAPALVAAQREVLESLQLSLAAAHAPRRGGYRRPGAG